MKKYSLFIIIIPLILLVLLGFLYLKNNEVERYGVVFRSSTSGDMRFNYYDIQQDKVLNKWESHPWFFAAINDLESHKSVDDVYNYVANNRDSVFKITGTKEKDDCEYYDNGTCLENITIKEIEIIEDKKGNVSSLENESQQQQNISTAQNQDYSDLELYKDSGNNPYMVGEPIIKDIDEDGLIEKVVRYNLMMADRSIQVLYIYREINGEYKLIKTFSGDPYGFAKIINEDAITVGRFLPIKDDVLKNWDDFEKFEVANYKWTKNGEVEISKNIIKASSSKDLSEEIRNNFN